MGDRVSIQFKKRDELSVVLFAHWGGMDFVFEAKKYAEKLKSRKETTVTDPLSRCEPSTVMVDFISRVVGKGKRIDSNYYIVATEEEGDNSDNGHHIISLD